MADLPPELEVIAIREANRMLIERDAAFTARIRDLENKLSYAEDGYRRWHQAFLDAKYPDILPTRVDLEKRIRELEAALRKIYEMHSCECGQLAFREDCTHHLAGDALRKDDQTCSPLSDGAEHG